MKNTQCPFCDIILDISSSRIIAENELSISISDGYPISLGHTLVIPRRHVASFFEITEAERSSLFDLLQTSKQFIDDLHSPDSYNIGINDGPDAGQTINHLHMHLIPRYQNDVKDPRGGIRWIMPDKADYWSKLK
jgi:diadenosine tetraphosphate (Ap4A) HIT family hydrolase